MESSQAAVKCDLQSQLTAAAAAVITHTVSLLLCAYLLLVVTVYLALSVCWRVAA